MQRNFSEQQLVRREKIATLKKLGFDAFAKTIKPQNLANGIQKTYGSTSREELVNKQVVVSVAGRIMSKRGPFTLIQDRSGQIQFYLSTKNYPKIDSLLKILDIGDIVWGEGILMKTQTNELAIRLTKLQLLTKSLTPLPEKFHKLKDVEERYRRRYVDLIMNPEAQETLRNRIKIIKAVREYFDNLDYLEVETPILEPILGGAAARPFKTFHNSLKRNFYLRVATELPLKKLIVGGMERVYEIGRIFRNEGIDTTHNPEFTSIEFYEAYSNLEGMMTRTEEVFRFVAKKLNLQTINYEGNEIVLDKPFARVIMTDAIKKVCGVDFLASDMTVAKAKTLAKEHHVPTESFFEFGHIVNAFFEEFVEPTLINPTFVISYPIEISPLAALDYNDSRFTQRAELFINCREYANMFTELIDPIDQLQRFESQANEREQGNEEANEIDMTFVEALEYGMPPTGGCGIGIDRMIMLMTNNHSIRDVVIFPHLKDRK